MKKLTLVQRFSFLCFLGLLIMALVLGHVLTKSLEANALLRSKELSAKVILEEGRSEIDAVMLKSPKLGSEYDEFSKIIDHLSLGPNIERVKVWNRDYTVIWSDDHRLVGERFPDNHELDEAYQGQISSEMKTPEKEENKYEEPIARLIELYVPITYPGSNEITGVLEVYQNLDPLYKDISGQKKTVWAVTVTGFVILYLLLFGIVWGASRRIDKQNCEIVESEKKYRRLVESAKDGIISLDSKGNVVLFNQAAERIFGFDGKKIIGESVSQLIPEEMREKHVLGLEAAVGRRHSDQVGRPTMELEGCRSDGTRIPIELSLSVSEMDGSPVFTAIVRDISERKAMQKHLLEVERQSTISILAGSIGHELNNAISVLMGYSAILENNPGDAKLAEKCASVFGKESERLRNHAQNILSLSKPAKPEVASLSLAELLGNTLSSLETSGILKGYSVEKYFEDDVASISGDYTQLEQVVRNLVINAVHAMSTGGALVVKLSRTKDPTAVEFSVADSGSGIPPEIQEKVFEPFFTTKGEGEGTGLGMYVIQKVINDHGGTIEMESEVGKGTTFTIQLPVTPS